MQDSSHLSAMFLLERQHNKLESVYYWLFRYNIILILFLCIGIQNHVIKSTREAIICNPNEISELVIRYDLKKIRDNPQLEVKYFRFDKDIRETWGYLLVWREHPVENWITIAGKLEQVVKKLSTQGKMTWPQLKMFHFLYYHTTVVLV